MSSEKKAFLGVRWNGLATGIVAILQFLQITILARFFLTPDDFGIFAILSLIIGLSKIFSDMGISNSIIHQKKISNEELCSLFIVSLLAGLLVAVLALLLSPVIGGFYDIQILDYLYVLAVTFIFEGIGLQYKILLQKDLMFKQLALGEVTSNSIAFVLAICLGYLGYGIWSLVWAFFVNSLVKNGMYIYLGKDLFVFKVYFNYTEIKHHVKFGFYQLGDRFLNYLNGQMDTLIIGKVLGIELLGFYNIAKNLVEKPYKIVNPIVLRVTTPLFALINDTGDRLKAGFIKTISYLMIFNLPVYNLIAIFSTQIILLMYGEKWLISAEILSYLSFVFVLRTINNPVGSLFVATGKVYLGFYWNLAMLAFFPLGTYLGATMGIIGVCKALLILQLLLIFPNYWILVKRLLTINAKEYFEVIYKPCLVAILPSSLSILITSIILSPLYSFLIGCFVYTISYVLLLYFVNKEVILTTQRILGLK